MEKTNAYYALLQTAQNNAVPLPDVLREIQKVIDSEVLFAEVTGDQAALEQWKKVPCEGSRPTAAELIT